MNRCQLKELYIEEFVKLLDDKLLQHFFFFDGGRILKKTGKDNFS